jgi:hypothetical protein
MKTIFNELIGLLRALLELIEENKHLSIGELQSVADSAQQILSLSSQFLLDADSDSLPQKPIIVGNKKGERNEMAECLRIIEADCSQEVDGSVEIAERGHAIISMEKRLRAKCQAELDALDGGMSRVFDALAGIFKDCNASSFLCLENLRHPDSYVYLAAINALCELSSWHHKTCLPKMMFLLKNWGADEDENCGDEAETSGNHYF